MGALAGPELAAAVSNAGACGVLGRVAGAPVEHLRQQIRHLRSLTDNPFGVNIILARLQEGWIDVCLEEQVPLLVLFWGDPVLYVPEAHRRGMKVFLQVGTMAEAQRAAEVGVDAIIAQGVEAGGHVKSTTALSTLVPEVVEALHPTPVIAAGGISNGRSLVAALSLGAHAVSMGTRFLCSDEALATPAYKERVLQSTAVDTVYTTLFNVGWDAPHRVLRNKAVTEWEAAGCPAPGHRPGEGTLVGGRNAAAPGWSLYATRRVPIPPQALQAISIMLYSVLGSPVVWYTTLNPRYRSCATSYARLKRLLGACIKASGSLLRGAAGVVRTFQALLPPGPSLTPSVDMTSDIKSWLKISLRHPDLPLLWCTGRDGASKRQRLILLISVDGVPPDWRPSSAGLDRGPRVLTS
jgi:NAD(P)H-dependent flavin oxidoreductase YrpB (nitropropane dioxygenase family)